MSRRALPALQRDIFFLALGSAWGTYTVVTAGPWPLMLISAATMMGPGFLRLWLSARGMPVSLESPSLGGSEQLPSLPSGSSGSSGAE